MPGPGCPLCPLWLDTHCNDAHGDLQAAPDDARGRDDVVQQGDLVQADQEDAQAQLGEAKTSDQIILGDRAAPPKNICHKLPATASWARV